MTGNTDMHLLVTDNFFKMYGCALDNQLVSGVITMRRDTSPLHRVDQVVD